MVKVDYTKVELAFDRSVNQLVITDIQISDTWKHLLEGTTTYHGNNPRTELTDKIIQKILLQATKQMKSIKKKDPDYYSRLLITPEEEAKYDSSPEKLTKKDWIRLFEIKDKMDQHLQTNQSTNQPDKPEDSAQIQEQIKEHTNKRYNVKKGWVPL